MVKIRYQCLISVKGKWVKVRNTFNFIKQKDCVCVAIVSQCLDQGSCCKTRHFSIANRASSSLTFNNTLLIITIIIIMAPVSYMIKLVLVIHYKISTYLLLYITFITLYYLNYYSEHSKLWNMLVLVVDNKIKNLHNF